MIEIDKILIWFKIDAFFWIGDIETCDQKKLDKIIIKLKKIAALCGCTEITVNASQGTILDKYFSSLATLKATSPVGFVSFNNDLELKNLKYTSADFDTF
ncbi:MAG: hypothetical protein IT235_06575 [Bacteroidia bacterium]|nr:hypothetical protein [Bacteroidia bacterium]